MLERIGFKMPFGERGRAWLLLAVFSSATLSLLLSALGSQEVLAGTGLSEPEPAAIESNTLAMIVLGLIMVATYVAIAFELVHKSLAAMTGACAAVIAAMMLKVFTRFDVVHEVIGHDLGVLGVLLGTSILVEIAGHSGLFHFISVKIVKKTGGAQLKLFWAMSILTVVFCSFLTIAPGTLIMVTLALAVTKELKYNPKPYIIVIALTANSGALVTFASGICTMMVGQKANLSYLDFFRVTTPFALFSALIATVIVRYLYRHDLKEQGDTAERKIQVASFDEWALVHDRRIFKRCAIILVLTTIGFATAQTMHVGLDLIAMCGGVAALLFSGFDAEKAIKTVKWPLIIFFIGLFVIIGAVQQTGLLNSLAGMIESLAQGNLMVTMMVMGIFVLILSGIVDNIPVAATLIPITLAMESSFPNIGPLWWTLVICSNLGGNSTPVGSVAAVIALHALEKERGIKIGWGEYLKVGALVLVIQGAFALAYLAAFLKLDLFPGGHS